jgi:hypothetical protein
MPKTALAVAFALVLPTFGGEPHNPTSSMQRQANRTLVSKVACSDNTTLLPDQRTPQACAETDFAVYGRPVLFSLRDGLAYGVSLAPDKPGLVTIWMDNQTEKPQTVYVCCNATFVRYIDVYNRSDQRVLSKLEIANTKPESAPFYSRDPRALAGCGCSGRSTVPPHSLKVVDHGDLKSSYTLTPGRYTIVEYPPRLANAPRPFLARLFPSRALGRL